MKLINLLLPASVSAASYKLSTRPSSPMSQPHVPQFISYSFEPAFWVEFFGEPNAKNNFTFSLLSVLHDHGARPIIRPGGITMDSMVFNSSQTQSVVRTENEKGGIYRSTIGPAFYKSWNGFPEGTSFVSTLNFGNRSIPIASGLAAASYEQQQDKILYYELGNEPTNYPSTRWNYSTQAYIAEWQNFTAAIDRAVDDDSHGKWWASSATTDKSGLNVRPADLIPAGVNFTGEVGQYSIHSYAFATCDPARAALATIPNILNHTGLLRYANEEIYPSAKAALDVGAEWIIGEFNSIACSGKPNVSDTFAQALWTADVELIYAVRNASCVHLHQGATLVFQSDQQQNTPGDDGTPGFSSYSLLYPVNSTKRGERRVLPVFVSQLLVAEALSDGGRIAALPTPEGLREESFSSYAVFDARGKLRKLVVLNMKPAYAGAKAAIVQLDLGKHGGARVKRMTAPSVDEKDSGKVTYAGLSYRNAKAEGREKVERVARNGGVSVRDSEAVLVIFD